MKTISIRDVKIDEPLHEPDARGREKEGERERERERESERKREKERCSPRR